MSTLPNQGQPNPAMLEQMMQDPQFMQAVMGQGGDASMQMPQDLNQIQQQEQQLDPAMMMQMMQGMPQQEPPDPLLQAISATLNVFMHNSSDERTKELNADIQSKVLKSLADTLSVLYTLAQPPEQQEQIPAELQFEMEQRKLDAELEITQARFQLEQQKADFDMQLKQAEAELRMQLMQQDAEIKGQQAIQDAELKQDQHYNNIALEEQKLSMQEEAMKSKAQSSNKAKS